MVNPISDYSFLTQIQQASVLDTLHQSKVAEDLEDAVSGEVYSSWRQKWSSTCANTGATPPIHGDA